MSESDPNHYLEEYHFDLLDELCDFCESDDLSLSKLQEKIDSLFLRMSFGESVINIDPSSISFA